MLALGRMYFNINREMTQFLVEYDSSEYYKAVYKEFMYIT